MPKKCSECPMGKMQLCSMEHTTLGGKQHLPTWKCERCDYAEIDARKTYRVH